MKSFYEKYREDDGELLAFRRSPYAYPAHFHKNFEIYILRRGRIELSINEKQYEMSDGQIAVIDSYDVHAYSVGDKGNDDCVLLIPYEYLQSFNAERRNLKIQNPIVKDETLAKEILKIVDEYVTDGREERVRIAGIGLILSVLYGKLSFTEDKVRDEVDLLRQILAYLQEHYREDVSRFKIAKELGYTETHVSRIFHRYLKMGISEYVNDLRLAYVEKLRKAGDTRTTIELLYEAGFKSQQTYYRQKKRWDAKL
ncbi:MAG: helix-turn-helix transcriptional regulator [Clostridia bacterium]|nr:helix-turn-helix transcriptional regulator [Clostridia bacterium]